MLPVPYYHVVFTLPGPIADIAYLNKAVLSAYWKKINPEKIIKEMEANIASHPVAFLDLAHISKGSQAEKLGITPHCMITKMPMHEGSDGKLHWVDKEGKVHSSKVEAGKFGFSHYPGSISLHGISPSASATRNGTPWWSPPSRLKPAM